MTEAQAIEHLELQGLVSDLGNALLTHDEIYGFRLDHSQPKIGFVVLASPSALTEVTALVQAELVAAGGENSVLSSVIAGLFEADRIEPTIDRVRSVVDPIAKADVLFEIGSGRIHVLVDGDAATIDAVSSVVAELQLGEAVEVMAGGDYELDALAGGGESLGSCTAGFAVTKNADDAILTAGHCPDDLTLYDSSQGGSTAVDISNSLYDAYEDGPVPVGGGNYRIDRQIHYVLPPHVGDPAIRVNANTGDRRAITGMEDVSTGLQICMSGITSKVPQCDEVRDTYVSVSEYSYGQVEAHYGRAGGDSGGPVYTEVLSGQPAKAVGIHNGYFRNDPGRARFTRVGAALSGTGFAVKATNGAHEYNELSTAQRVLDTRSGGGAKLIGARNVNFGGRIPSDASAVVVNVTSTQSSTGSLKLYPRGDSIPTGSALKMSTGVTLAQLAVVPLGQYSDITVRTSNWSHVVIDLLGYLDASGASISLQTPSRTYDSRNYNAPLGAGQSRNIKLEELPWWADGAIVNLTAVSGTQNTHLIAYHPSRSRPSASNLNVTGWEPVANMVMVPVANIGGEPHLRLYNRFGSVHVIVDVLGYYDSSASDDLVPVPQTRLHTGIQIGERATHWIPIVGLPNAPVVPQGATGAVLAITARNPSATRGYLSVTANGGSSTSTVNYETGRQVTNHIAVELGGDTAIRVYNSHGTTTVDIDIEGYLYDPDS